MEVLYNNLYTHFVFTTKDRKPVIEEMHRDRIEKYITGIANICRRNWNIFKILSTYIVIQEIME